MLKGASRKGLVCLSLGFLALTASAFAEQIPKRPTPTPFERKQFLEAERALQRGDLKRFQGLKAHLRHYPLYPYLEYADLSRRLKNLPQADYETFMKQYHDSPLSDQLQTQFLHQLAYNQRWKDFLTSYQPSHNETLQCHYLNAQLAQHQNTAWILGKTTALWLNAKPAPTACQRLFSIWEQSNHRTPNLVWQKIKLCIETEGFNEANQLARYLTRDEHPLLNLWISVKKQPHLVSKSHHFTGKHPAILEILVTGISELAKQNPEQAIKYWKAYSQQHHFQDRHWGIVVRAIGLAFAQRRHPRTEQWLDNIPKAHLTEAVFEARLRVSLHKENWTKMLGQMKALPPSLAANEYWRYWKARALEKVGKWQESQRLFAELAQKRSYYGLLSKQKLAHPIQVHHQKHPLSEGLVERMSRHIGIARVLELIALGRHQKARAEWLKFTEKCNDEEKHAVALLALRWELPNLAILALSKTDNNHDLSLRFPIVYRNAIFRTAQKESLDPAWILAVTRQESAFIPHAQSHAGAMGLMQLMPNTAKMVAKQKNIPLKNKVDLLHAETNIRLGSSYLKMMLEEHKNPVLALAAYNAGPGRIKQWLPPHPLPADNWIETIPFRDTREYVKNVLTYFVIYQQLLGKQPLLKPHMPVVLGIEKKS